MKNQNLFLTGILTITISCPAIADIAANANSAKCDNGTLDTYQGESTLQAQWDANTINLKWYTDSSANNGQEITPTNNAAATCTYDDAITLPTNPISKPGYEFAGWRVRTSAAPSQPQQTTFDLSTLAQYIEIGGDYYGYQNDSTGEYGPKDYNTETYGITGDQQWATEFEYGTVRGEAVCSTQQPETFWYNNDDTFTSDHFATTLTDDPEAEKRYCWCKPTGFDAEKDGTYLNVSSSSWVFSYDNGGAGLCARLCANGCAYSVYYNVDFRRAVFGVAGAE